MEKKCYTEIYALLKMPIQIILLIILCQLLTNRRLRNMFKLENESLNHNKRYVKNLITCYVAV